MGRKTNPKIMYLSGREVEENWRVKCRLFVAISRMQGARGVSHHFIL